MVVRRQVVGGGGGGGSGGLHIAISSQGNFYEYG
jgi:hypothetical protein